MNCREAETLLFAERDAVLGEPRRAALAAHVGQCAACRHVRQELGAAATAWRAADAAVALPAVEVEWHAIRRQIHGAKGSATGSLAGWRPLWWSLATAAAAAIIALVAIPQWTKLSETPAAAGEWTYVSYVEVENASDSTLVYEDAKSGWLVVWVGDGPVTSGS